METALTILPNNHSTAIQLMHPHAAGLMKAKYEGQKITGLTPEDMLPAVRSAIQDCFKSLGHWDSSKDASVLEYQTKEMVMYFLKDFKNLTIQELRIILRNMVKGDYRVKESDLITCTVQSMCHAIKSYLASQEYKMAFTDYQTKLRLDAPQKKELSPEEMEKALQRGCIKAYEAFLEDGSIPYASTVVYDYLRKVKKITWTDSERREIEKRANLAYSGKLKEGIGLEKTTAEGLKGEKKRQALKAYFDWLKSQGVKQLEFTPIS